jgi:hypothetical protein
MLSLALSVLFVEHASGSCVFRSGVSSNMGIKQHGQISVHQGIDLCAVFWRVGCDAVSECVRTRVILRFLAAEG